MFKVRGLVPGVFKGRALPSEAIFNTKKSNEQIKNASCSKKIVEILII